MTTNGRKQHGMTLVEVIVAAAIALVGFLVALTLYQAARQSFKKGEQAANQQQEVRVAYDRMMKDLRLAGYNWNATGEDRPGEEQIEGAWAGAITVRADYDFEDAALSQDPENLIAGSTAKATVGNDEIVTYCLMKPDGSGGSNLVFNADVDSSTTASSTLYGTVAVRDGVTEAVTIPGVDLTQTNPPYNLYRVYRNNAKSPTSPDTIIRKDLLAENVKSLTFTYLDSAGATITPPGGTEAAADKTTRASIKKINVTIVGMTGQPDPAYTDPTDSNTLSQHYRKFSLTSQVDAPQHRVQGTGRQRHDAALRADRPGGLPGPLRRDARDLEREPLLGRGHPVRPQVRHQLDQPGERAQLVGDEPLRPGADPGDPLLLRPPGGRRQQQPLRLHDHDLGHRQRRDPRFEPDHRPLDAGRFRRDGPRRNRGPERAGGPELERGRDEQRGPRLRPEPLPPSATWADTACTAPRALPSRPRCRTSSSRSRAGRTPPSRSSPRSPRRPGRTAPRSTAGPTTITCGRST